MSIVIIEQAEETLGNLKYILFRIPFISDAEDWAADRILGQEVEAVRQWIAEYELPFADELFPNVCEAR